MADRNIALGMTFRADMGPARAEYEKFIKEIQGRTISVPVSGGAGSAASAVPTSTLGGLSVPTSGGLAIGAASPNFSYYFAQLGQQLSAAIAQLGRTLASGGSPGGQPSQPGLSPGGQGNRGRGILGLAGLNGREAIAGYFAYRGLEALGREYVRERELDEASRYEGPEAAARVAAQQTRADRNNLGSSLLRSVFAGAVSGGRAREDSTLGKIASFVGAGAAGGAGIVAGLLGGGSLVQSDDDRAAEDRKTEALIKGGEYIEASRERARAATRRIESVGEAPYFQQKHAITNRAADTRREAERAKRAALDAAVIADDPTIYNETRVAADDAIKRANTLEKVEQRQNFLERVTDPLTRIGHSDEVLSARAKNQVDRANRLEIKYAGEERVEKLRREKDPLLQSVQTEESDRLRAFDRQIQNRNESIGLGQSTHSGVLDLLLKRNTVGAAAAGIAGGALSKGLSFEHEGLDDFAKGEYRLGIKELGLEKQQYLDAFHGQQVNPFAVDLSNEKRTENPIDVLKEIRNQMQTLNDKLKIQN